MSKSRQAIKIDFQEAKAQANSLDNIAYMLEMSVVKQMDNTMQTLAGAWEGENATAFLGKEEILRVEINKTAGNLRDIADDIRDIAKAIYDAEMENLRRARERKS